ncbi:MAG: GFA family protein, partial [Alphaproteobacteria bacterium]|nr:GFA family protein [Alphaproteobacteria bacterium]
MRTASCACGQLNISCDGEPRLVALCHCLDCQRRTGSTYGIAAFFARSSVRAEGTASTYRRLSDGGHAVTFHFCPECGSSVFWEPERKPD